MSIHNYGSFQCIDHSLPIAPFFLLEEKKKKNCSTWLNRRPLYIKENSSERAKNDHRVYFMQYFEAHQFFELIDEEGIF